MTTPTMRKRSGSGPPPVPSPPVQSAPDPDDDPSALFGLSKPQGPGAETSTARGTWLEKGSEQAYLLDDSGKVDGRTSEKTDAVGAGIKGSVSKKTRSFDGKTTKESEGEASGLAGVEASAKRLSKHSSQEISVGIETLARAGLFGEAKQTASIKRGLARASMEAKASGGMGAEAKMKAEAKIDRSGAIPALLATFEASVRAGIWAEGEFKGTVGLGPVEASLITKLNALAGAEAKVEAKGFASLREGVGGELKASAFAGAKAEGSVAVEIGIPNKAQIELGLEAEAMAGAMAKFEGGVRVSLSGVSAKFEAEAFAGAKASATGKGSIKLMGRTVLAAKGTVEVSAGVGGKAKGEFTLIDGKLKFGAALAGALGIGAGAEVEAEVDFGALADIIYASLYEIGKGTTDPAVKEASPDFDRKPLTDPGQAEAKRKVGYDAVYDNFVAYAKKKNAKTTGIGDKDPGKGPALRDQEGIKRDRVQAIINDAAPLLRAEFAYVEVDEGIQKAALEAFAGHLTGLTVQAGKIRGWEATTVADAKGAREQAQKKAAQAKVRDPFLDELHGYCRKKMTSGTHDLAQADVQKIITKHYTKVKGAFTDAGAADQVVTEVVAEMKNTYLAELEITGGVISKFQLDQTKVEGLKKRIQGKADDAALQTALTALDGKLVAYLKTTLDKKGGVIDTAGVNKVVQGSTKSIASQMSKPETADAVHTQIVWHLADAVESVKLVGGAVTEVKLKPNGMQLARAARNAEADAAKHSAAAATFGRSLAAYKEQKTSRGAHGLKQDRVIEMLKSAYKGQEAWLTSGSADADIRGAAETALGDDLVSIGVKNGVVETFNFNNTKLAADKAFKKENGTSLLGGEEDDNQRRSIVTAAVRAPLKATCDAFRTQAEQDPTAAKLTPAMLDEMIARAVKKIRADANTPVGAEALQEAIKLYLPMVKEVEVTSLKVTKLELHATWAAETKTKKDLLVARDSLRAQVKKLGARATAESVQKIVDVVKPKLAGLSPEEVDTIISMEIVNALLGLLVKTDPVTVTGGKVTKLQLNPRK